MVCKEVAKGKEVLRYSQKALLAFDAMKESTRVVSRYYMSCLFLSLVALLAILDRMPEGTEGGVKKNFEIPLLDINVLREDFYFLAIFLISATSVLWIAQYLRGFMMWNSVMNEEFEDHCKDRRDLTLMIPGGPTTVSSVPRFLKDKNSLSRFYLPLAVELAYRALSILISFVFPVTVLLVLNVRVFTTISDTLVASIYVCFALFPSTLALLSLVVGLTCESMYCVSSIKDVYCKSLRKDELSEAEEEVKD